MKLTDKCKVDFEKWYEPIGNINAIRCYTFYELPNSMQYGVYVDYFDSVDIDTEIVKTLMGKFYILINDDRLNDDKFESRPEARTQVIEKANEIYNTL